MARRNRKSSRSSNSTASESGNLEAVKAYWQWFLANWNNRPFQYRVGAIVGLILLVFLLTGSSKSSKRSNQEAVATTSAWRQHLGWNSKGYGSGSFVTLVPGELPGYTGWARPASTLAKYFHLDQKMDLLQPTVTGKPWEITVRCSQAEDCANGGALFFVRAYGPAVLVGQVQDNQDGSYLIKLLPKDPGAYTVEVVLTFSNPPHIGQFPLPPKQPEPAYEGYLLPGFPIPLLVVEGDNYNEETDPANYKSLPVCEMEDLFEPTATSAWEKARWVVTDKINQPNHMDDHHYKDQVTFDGYQVSQNSLGIMMEYQHDTCRILPHIAPEHPQNPLNQCTEGKGPLHFIFIGDSNMRLQRNLFESLFLGLPEDQREKSHYNANQIRASYMDLTGGALRCNLIGDHEHNVTRFFDTIKARVDETLEKPERYVILFNTGMHDIHRLCSHEFEADRLTYLGESATDASNDFHCVLYYRMAVEGLAKDILNFPAELRVFQSTTAGMWSLVSITILCIVV